MKTRNATQLKAFINNIAKKEIISSQLVMQNYMMERFLERLSLSKYKNNFIIKGGILISSMVGIASRTTMDIDTTIKGCPLKNEIIEKIITEIISINIDDNINFEIIRTEDIRDNDEYQGIRVYLIANYFPMKVHISIDITAGDIITPKEIEYSYKLLFDDKEIKIFSYNIETLLAEKIETILSRNIANTRIRDFYDTYILCKCQKDKINKDVLKMALIKTIENRGNINILNQYIEIMKNIKLNKNLTNLWLIYQEKYNYAKGILFEDICDILLALLEDMYA